MLTSTPAIVLRTLRYRDTSGIVSLLTEQHGRVDCIVKGLYGPRSQRKHSLYMVGSLLEVVIYQKPGRDLQHLTEGSLQHPCYRILAEPLRQVYLQVCAEVLLKTIPANQEPDPQLYHLLYDTVMGLEQLEHGLYQLLLHFLLQLAAHSGFTPIVQQPYNPDTDYRLVHESGMLVPAAGAPPEGAILAQLLGMSRAERLELKIPKTIRRDLLTELLSFLSFHLHTDLLHLRTLRIFEEIFLS